MHDKPQRQTYVDAAQLALAVLLAKVQDDDAAADHAFATFENDAQMATGFMLIAELAVAGLAQATEQDQATLIRNLMAQAAESFPDPRN